jgi:hypothetical protein
MNEPIKQTATHTPADAVAPAPNANPAADAAAHAKAKPAKPPTSPQAMKLRAVALTAAFLGIVFGGTVEYFVGGLLDSTGWFGPTLDNIVAEQTANFEDIRTKLAELGKAAPGSPEALALQKELSTLVATQEKLTGRTHEEIAGMQDELTKLRAQLLMEKGSAGGADFWLAPNESMTVGEEGKVFSLLSIGYSGQYAYTNLTGTQKRLQPGDFVEFETKDSICRVIYKAGTARADGRFGFDLVCEPK